MIEIKNLVKRYGDFAAVNDISFTIEDGEIVGFLGPNGAGKTTTMSILTGCLSMTSGSVTINGIDIFDQPLEAKKQIGYLPEFPPLYLEMTVKEYLNFVYDLKACTLDRKSHIGEICDRVKLTHVENRIIKNLSKGYRQRVGIAQALIGNPRVIIFDEPTVGLDPKQIIEIRTLIRDLGRDHTVILSTHILPEVQMVCDRIVIINRGKIVADEKTEDIEKVVAGSRQIQLKVCGPQKEVQNAIKGLTGIKYCEVINLCASHAWPIIGMEAIGLNLEEIFISVVDENGQGGKKKKGRKGDK